MAVKMLVLQCWGNSTLGSPGASAASHTFPAVPEAQEQKGETDTQLRRLILETYLITLDIKYNYLVRNTKSFYEVIRCKKLLYQLATCAI